MWAAILVSGAGAGVLAHNIYDIVTNEGTQLFVQRQWSYYLTLSLAVITGCAVAFVFQKHTLRLLTALLGGGGIAFSCQLVTTRVSTTTVPPAASLAIILVVGVVGFLVQIKLRKVSPAEEEEE